LEKPLPDLAIREWLNEDLRLAAIVRLPLPGLRLTKADD
jgi:hypothetical protein